MMRYTATTLAAVHINRETRELCAFVTASLDCGQQLTVRKCNKD